jgi:hypothetical protein
MLLPWAGGRKSAMGHVADSESEPSLDEVERRMRPGAFSQGGFLGPHERLRDVLAEDAQTVTTLGVTCERIAERLRQTLERALVSPRRRARVDGLFVQVEKFKGFQICPWARSPHQGQCTAGGGVQFASIEWDIANARGEKIHGPGLAVHLIRDHHFFEGKDSPYRLDPRRLVSLLCL